MKLFAVTGNPISFSKSPKIFNSIFKENNIDAKYIHLTAQTAKEAVDLFKKYNMSGMNVTAPFKTDIIPFLDKIDDVAKKINAVNTVVNENGLLVGYNTDFNGIIDTLKNVEKKKVLILGAGGAARAVVYTIKEKQGIPVIFNRTESRAKSLAEYFNVQYCNKDNLKLVTESADIIINTVPSGVKIIDDSWLKPKHIIFDAIYYKSEYKQTAEKIGCEFYSGEQWLINQAKAAFKLFFKNNDADLSNIIIEN